jgi:hypothetical protein
MDYTIILNIGPIPDDNPVLIGTDNSAKPYTNMISYSNITCHCCIAGHKKRRAGDRNIHTHNTIEN